MSQTAIKTLNGIRSDLETLSKQLTKFHGDQQKSRYSPRRLVLNLLNTLTPLALMSSAFEILNPKTFNINTTAFTERFVIPFTKNLPIALKGAQEVPISYFTAILLVASAAAQILTPLIGKHTQNTQTHLLNEIRHLWAGLATNIPNSLPKFYSEKKKATDLTKTQLKTTIAYLSALQAKQAEYPQEFQQISKRISGQLEKIPFEKYKMILYFYLYNMEGKASDLYSAEQNLNESCSCDASGNLRNWFKGHKNSLNPLWDKINEESSGSEEEKYA